MKAPGDAPDVTVTITDNQGNVNKPTATLSKAGGNEVVWSNPSSNSKTMQINFPAGSPFTSSNFSVAPGNTAPSGTPTAPADPNKHWAYTVTPDNSGAGADPIIIVDN